MNTVRPYQDKDKENVQKICLEFCDSQDPTTDENKYILTMYCNYYIEQESENCFVAVNDQDEAVGYILCAENYDKYASVFSELYLPQTAGIGLKKYIDAKMDMLSHSMYKIAYPAHIHIDIDKEYQRIGLGSLLISTLKAHLKKKNIKGMMLVCDPKNEQAINFYKKNGFKDLITTKMGHAMALEFDE